MTYEVYRNIFIAGAVLSGIMLAVTILQFFLLKIPSVIGNLSGANQRRAIKTIQIQTEGDGTGLIRQGTKQRGADESVVTDSKRPPSNRKETMGMTIVTEKINAAQPSARGGKKILRQEANVTTLLGASYGTDDRGAAAAEQTEEFGRPRVFFEILYEITYIHTDEKTFG